MFRIRRFIKNIPPGVKDFLEIWAAIIAFIAAVALFGGFVIGNVMLTMWAAHHTGHLWWTIAVNFLSVTGGLAALIYSADA